MQMNFGYWLRKKLYCRARLIVSFRSPSFLYLLTVGVEVVYFLLITLRHTSQSVWLLWKGDQPVAETSTWQNKHSQETNIHAPGGVRNHDPSKRSAADRAATGIGHDWYTNWNWKMLRNVSLVVSSVKMLSVALLFFTNPAWNLFNPLKTKRICFI
jgi:hypothetical protein